MNVVIDKFIELITTNIEEINNHIQQYKTQGRINPNYLKLSSYTISNSSSSDLSVKDKINIDFLNLYYIDIIRQLKKEKVPINNICEITDNNKDNNFIDFINGKKSVIDFNNNNWFLNVNNPTGATIYKYHIICVNIMNINMSTLEKLFLFINSNLHRNGSILIKLNNPLTIILKHLQYIIDNGIFTLEKIYTVENPNLNIGVIYEKYIPHYLLLGNYSGVAITPIKHMNVTNVNVKKIEDTYIKLFSNLNDKINIYKTEILGLKTNNDIKNYLIYNTITFAFNMGFIIKDKYIDIFNLNNLMKLIGNKKLDRIMSFNFKNNQFNNWITKEAKYEKLYLLYMDKNDIKDVKFVLEDNIRYKKTDPSEYIIKKIDKKIDLIIFNELITLKELVLAWKILKLDGHLVINNNIDNDKANKTIIYNFRNIFQNDLEIINNHIQFIIKKINIY